MWLWGLIQCNLTSFVRTHKFGQLLPNFEMSKYDNSAMMMDPSLTSTAYEGAKTPNTFLKWIWEPFQVDLGPQPMHLDIICSPAATQEIGQLPNIEMSKYDGSGMTWRIHFPINSI
jgi:hypothetical protein